MSVESRAGRRRCPGIVIFSAAAVAAALWPARAVAAAPADEVPESIATADAGPAAPGPSAPADGTPSGPGTIAPVPLQRVAANPAEPKEAAGRKQQSPLTLDGGVDVASAYYFRGYKVENRGVIVQPYATLHLNAVQTDDVSISPYVSTWNSVHSEAGDAADWEHWFECDVIGGVSISRDGWTLSASYNLYLYPDANARQTDEVGVILAYDDTDLAARLLPGLPAGFAFNPHVGYYREVRDRNGSEDSYLEAGLEPRWPIPETPWTLSAPALLGMSLDGAYTTADGHNSPFGYVSGGLKASYKLDDHWSLNAAVAYIHLWADSAVRANDDSRHVVVGTAGVGFSF